MDRTNYFETMPATDENLEFGIELEADRLVNSYVKREDLVARNDRRPQRVRDAARTARERILNQRMMAAAYEWHNYGKSTIGNRTDIERVPIDNLQAFYHKFYQPDNAMLVVAGKFDEKKAARTRRQVLRRAQAPAERELTDTYTEEPAQDGERLVTLRRVGTVGAVGAGLPHPGRRPPRLRRRRSARDAPDQRPVRPAVQGAGRDQEGQPRQRHADRWHDPGVLEISARSRGRTSRPSATLLIEGVENLDKSPITADEVKRARPRFVEQFDKEIANSSGWPSP